MCNGECVKECSNIVRMVSDLELKEIVDVEFEISGPSIAAMINSGDLPRTTEEDNQDV